MILRTTHSLMFALCAGSPALAQLALDYLRAAASLSKYEYDARTLPNAGTSSTTVQVRLSCEAADSNTLDEFRFRVERLLESLEMVGIERLAPTPEQEAPPCADSAE